MKKLLSLLLALVMVLSLVSVVHAAEIKDFRTFETQSREMETFNFQLSQSASDHNVLSNCIDLLLSNDNYGRLVPGLAEAWGTEDNGKTWTFHIRKGVKWVDYLGKEKADLTAEDFLYGLEWILNYGKNGSTNTDMPMEMIQGATEYFNYTKEHKDDPLTNDLTKFKEMVAFEAVDDYTLKVTCVANLPYFDTLGTYNCLAPLPVKMIEELGIEGYKAVEFDKLWYCGPYTVTSYIHQNEKILTKNPLYWNKDAKLFDTVTIKMVAGVDNALELFRNGELDEVILEEGALKTIYENKDNEFHNYLTERRPKKYSYQFHFVYDKKLENGDADVNWNTAVANEAFRLSWYYGLDMTPVLRRINAISPFKCANYGYTGPSLVYTKDGTDYQKLVQDRMGISPNNDSFVRYDKEKGLMYKEQAIKELKEAGVTLPVQVDYYIKAGSQPALDGATVLKQTFADCLGEDYVVLNIKTYVSSLAQEVRNPQLASVFVNGWGADYGDPYNFLGQEIYGTEKAYYSKAYSKINNVDASSPIVPLYKEYTDLVVKASAINDDLDARYNAFADAEAYMLKHALVIPHSFEVSMGLSCVNEYSKTYSLYGSQNMRYVNWETNDQMYTTEDAANNLAAYEANRK